jgi:hypothetical protein
MLLCHAVPCARTHYTQSESEHLYLSCAWHAQRCMLESTNWQHMLGERCLPIMYAADVRVPHMHAGASAGGGANVADQVKAIRHKSEVC